MRRSELLEAHETQHTSTLHASSSRLQQTVGTLCRTVCEAARTGTKARSLTCSLDPELGRWIGQQAASPGNNGVQHRI